jgi:hypothetical protein
MKFQGGCLCGEVRYSADDNPLVTGHCYCRDCRRSSGTAHCTHLALPDVTFRAAGEVRFFAHPADSGNIVRRGFCPQCGSPLYSTNDGTPGIVYIRASSLDNPEVISPQLSVYASRAPAWDQPPSELPAFPEMPPAGPPAARP